MGFPELRPMPELPEATWLTTSYGYTAHQMESFARAAIRVLQSQLRATERERNNAIQRADALARELDEWKSRFDKLLERTPKD